MNICKLSVRPTKHYLEYHSNVEWDRVILTILSPTTILQDRRYGKDRFTYIRKTKNSIIKAHVKEDKINEIIWVINAFKDEMP